MNLYFLVEGRRTEKKVYPKWLGYLLPSLERVDSPKKADENNYFLVSGGGYPSMLEEKLENSPKDVAATPVYDYLVIVLDADEETPAERREEVNRSVTEAKEKLTRDDVAIPANCEIEVIVQNRCIETWFLGNKEGFNRNPDSPELRGYIEFYDVSENDPELMYKPTYIDWSIAQFHFNYLIRMLQARRLRYTKHRPGAVLERHYVDQLKDRLSDNPDHLPTLKGFFDFCDLLHEEMP